MSREYTDEGIGEEEEEDGGKSTEWAMDRESGVSFWTAGHTVARKRHKVEMIFPQTYIMTFRERTCRP